MKSKIKSHTAKPEGTRVSKAMSVKVEFKVKGLCQTKTVSPILMMKM